MSIKSEILKRLYKGEICGELLARDLGVSRTAIWKNVKQLISEGFDVQAKSRGYVLFGPTPLCKEGVAHYLNSFWSVDVVDETPSTNDLAKIKGSEGCDRYAIIAKRQSKGRGRLQRPFFAPEGGIYLSVVIRPKLHVSECGKITAYSAVATARAIEKFGISVGVKWVNDLYIGEKKVCGVLSEGSVGMEGGMLDYVVIGVGINVKDVKFPPELQDIATSLEKQTGSIIDLNKLSAFVIEELGKFPEEIKSGKFIKEYRARSIITGARVYSAEDGEVTVLGIDDDCALIVDASGVTKKYTAGEVSLRLR